MRCADASTSSVCNSGARCAAPRAKSPMKIPRHKARNDRGNAMRSQALLGVLAFIFAVSTADAATISGTVTGPDGAPVRAAFVQARHAGMKMTVSVLTDNQGKYVVESLPAGDYRLSI